MPGRKQKRLLYYQKTMSTYEPPQTISFPHLPWWFHISRWCRMMFIANRTVKLRKQMVLSPRLLLKSERKKNGVREVGVVLAMK